MHETNGKLDASGMAFQALAWALMEEARAERLLKPRLLFLTAPKAEQVIGGFCLLLAVVLAMPIPRTANPLLVVVSTDQAFATRSAESNALAIPPQETALAISQAKISSQKQVLNPSDAPGQAANILRLHSIIDRQTTFGRTIESAQTRLNNEDSALSSALSRMRPSSNCAGNSLRRDHALGF